MDFEPLSDARTKYPALPRLPGGRSFLIDPEIVFALHEATFHTSSSKHRNKARNMTDRKNVKMQSRLPFQPIASTARDAGRNIDDAPHRIAASSTAESIESPSPQVLHTPKNFGDLPGGQKPPVS